jgi:hypothetical protein
MSTQHTEDIRADDDRRVKQIVISVNFKPVTMPDRHATGIEIKKTAIAQGVNIQLDFVLFRDKGHGWRDPIRDDEKVELHRGDKFEAVPGDDNS